MGERIGHRLRRALPAALALAAAALLAACGGGESQDENEPEATYKLDVISASFPGRQRLSEETKLQITVRNVGDEEIPNLAMTVDGLNQRTEDPSLANPRRSIWIINRPPFNSASALPDTWTLGPVPAGEVRTATWRVTAIRTGTYTVRYAVNAGTDGNATAELPDGSPPRGSFIARISPAAGQVAVN